MELTKEQQEILDVDLFNSDKKVLVINALAGSGKTTTLIEKVKKHPELKFCYLSFNKAIKEDVNEIINKQNISNLSGLTMHGLAYREVLKKFGYPPIQNLNVSNVQQLLKGEYGIQVWMIYKTILLFNRYCNQVLNFNDFKDKVREMTPTELSFLGFNDKNIHLFDNCIKYVEIVYNKMLNRQSNFITHNFYLKYFIDNLKEFNFNDFDMFLFDEAQDLNEPMAVFVKEIVNKEIPVILVGDYHQTIYGFIRSIDIMALLEKKASEIVIKKQLTNTFRFESASKIESECNIILGLRKEKIKGKASFTDKNINNEAFLSRVNKSIFDKCLELIDDGKKYDLIGGIKSFDIDTITDIYYLIKGFYKSIKNKYISSFSGVSNFILSITENNDIELMSNFLIASICDSKGVSPEQLFTVIEKNIDYQSNIKVGTIHKTKGLGFDYVKILEYNTDEYLLGLTDSTEIEICLEGDDYKVLTLTDTNLFEEINILYVGISRAKKQIDISHNCYVNTLSFIKQINENKLIKLKHPSDIKNNYFKINDTYVISENTLKQWKKKAKGSRFNNTI